MSVRCVPCRRVVGALVLLIAATLGTPAACAAPGAPAAPAATARDSASAVGGPSARDARRAAILEVARAYATHPWRATSANVLHGPDEDGIHVDTPDQGHLEGGFRADGSLNTGVPYKWGGFTSLADFDAAVAAGKPAGQLTDGVNLDASEHAVGVDCSGLVARCWNLPLKQSTRSLARLCFELPAYDALLPGDLIDKFDAHAMVFVAFEGEDRSRARVIEAAFPSVTESVYPVASLEAAGFLPFRYKPLDERWVDVERGAQTVALDPQRGQWIAEGEPETFEAGTMPQDVDPASVLDAVLPDVLPDARPGDWVAYGVGNVDGALPMEVTRVVASNDSADGGAITIQTSTALGEQGMETLESHPARRSWAARMLALEDSGQALEAMAVVSGSRTPGRWVEGGVELPGTRVDLRLQGSMTARGQALELEVALRVIVSPRVPLEGIVRWERETTYRLPSGPGLSSRRYQLAGFGRAGAADGP